MTAFSHDIVSEKIEDLTVADVLLLDSLIDSEAPDVKMYVTANDSKITVYLDGWRYRVSWALYLLSVEKHRRDTLFMMLHAMFPIEG